MMTIDKFQNIVHSIRPKLLRMAKQMVKKNDEAEDLVQEVLIRLWQARERLESYDNIEFVAIRALKNINIDKFRKKEIKYEKMPDNEFKINEINSDNHIESTETLEVLIKIIQQLPDLQRLIMKLKDIEGYEIEEIVKITQSTPEAIRVNLSRARKKVREMYINMNNTNI